MGRLFKAFLFKLTRDLTFRITLIIGVGFALLIAGMLFLIDSMAASDGEATTKLLTGENMLALSLTPGQTYSLAIPINVAIFICLEFTQGSIRNKIITGNSKFSIYLSLFLSGLLFCFALMTVYVLICFGLGCVFGGFNPNGAYLSGLLGLGYNFTPEYFVKLIVASILVYTSIVSFTVFIATTFRNIGPCIPLVIVVLLILTTFAPLVTQLMSASLGEDGEGLVWFMRIVNPLHVVGESTLVINAETKEITLAITNETFIAGICSNIFYATLFFGFGALEFKKRDVK